LNYQTVSELIEHGENTNKIGMCDYGEEKLDVDDAVPHHVN